MRRSQRTLVNVPARHGHIKLAVKATATRGRGMVRRHRSGRGAVDGRARHWRRGIGSGAGSLGPHRCLGGTRHRRVGPAGLGDGDLATLSGLGTSDAVDWPVAGRAGGGDPGAVGATAGQSGMGRTWPGRSGGRSRRRRARRAFHRPVIQFGQDVVRIRVPAGTPGPADGGLDRVSVRGRRTHGSQSTTDHPAVGTLSGGCRCDAAHHNRWPHVQGHVGGEPAGVDRPGARGSDRRALFSRRRSPP